MAVTVYENQSRLNWINAGWVAATNYVVHDALAWGGASYRCILDHTAAAGNEPGVGASWQTYWAIVADKGAAGAAGTNGAISQLQDEAVNLTVRPTINFTGAGVTATDDAGNNRTNVTIPGGGGGGGVLAFRRLTPAADQVGTSGTVLGTHVRLNTTDLWITFTAPSTGNVMLEAMGIVTQNSTGYYLFGWMDATPTLWPDSAQQISNNTTASTEGRILRSILTGLTAGNSYTFYLSGFGNGSAWTFRWGPSSGAGGLYGPGLIVATQLP